MPSKRGIDKLEKIMLANAKYMLLSPAMLKIDGDLAMTMAQNGLLSIQAKP
jgi:hypothetical protein